MSQPASIEIKRYQCRHIFTDGHRCGSPCLKREQFCYYHHTTRRPAGNTRNRGPEQTEFDISIAEDRSAIQSTIGEVLRRIARNEIDPKRAGLLLYGLQIASLNIARAAEPARDSAPVEEITADPELGTLAPTAEITAPQQRKGFAAILIEEFKRQQQEAQPAAKKPQWASGDPSAKPAILPLIQASHSQSHSRKVVILSRRRRIPAMPAGKARALRCLAESSECALRHERCPAFPEQQAARPMKDRDSNHVSRRFGRGGSSPPPCIIAVRRVLNPSKRK
jgi:hypothetical protein